LPARALVPQDALLQARASAVRALGEHAWARELDEQALAMRQRLRRS
jgi:hypothetical protein